MLTFFPSGGCVDDVVNIQTNYQFTSVTVIDFMNGAGVCVLGYTKNCFERVHLFNINTTNLKSVMRNQDIKRQFFQSLDNLYIEAFFVNGESAFFVDVVKYTLSNLYCHCNQNCNFYYF